MNKPKKPKTYWAIVDKKTGKIKLDWHDEYLCIFPSKKKAEEGRNERTDLRDKARIKKVQIKILND